MVFVGLGVCAWLLDDLCGLVSLFGCWLLCCFAFCAWCCDGSCLWFYASYVFALVVICG